MTRTRGEATGRDITFLYVLACLHDFMFLCFTAKGGCDKLAEVIPDRGEFLIHGLR